MNYTKYKRGHIVYVSFSPSVGTELSGCHYAIVLNKKDYNSSSNLTVLPLTSKDKKNNLFLGPIIQNSLAKHFMELCAIQTTKREELEKKIIKLNEEYESFNGEQTDEQSKDFASRKLLLEKDIEEADKEKSKLESLANKITAINKHSYGKILDITTICKSRIISRKSKHPIFDKLSVTTEILNKIDAAIIENFTN